MKPKLKVLDNKFALAMFRINRHIDLFRHDRITTNSSKKRYEKAIDEFMNEQYNDYFITTKLSLDEILEQFSINEELIEKFFIEDISELKLQMMKNYYNQFCLQILDEKTGYQEKFKEEFLEAFSKYYYVDFKY